MPVTGGPKHRLAALTAAALAAVLAFSSVDPAHAEKRVALVIGNSTYAGLPKLANPEPDARAIAKMLEAAGFDVGEVKLDIGFRDFQRALSDLNRRARDADIAVVYFAGHGIEVDRVNWLVPVDAKLESEFDVDAEAISLDRVVKAIAPARALRLVILDACRNDPFRRKMSRGTRNVGERGLGQIEEPPRNTLVAYAARAGTVAQDGAPGGNSPYVKALVQHLPRPGLDIRLALGQVRDDVLTMTASARGGPQEPHVYGSLGGGRIMLVPGADSDPAQGAFEIARSVGTREAFETFLKRHPRGPFAEEARKVLGAMPVPELDLEDGMEIRIRVLLARPKQIMLLPDAKSAAVLDDGGAVNVWNIETGRFNRSIAERDNSAIGVSPEGELTLIGTSNAEVYAWPGLARSEWSDLTKALAFGVSTNGRYALNTYSVDEGSIEVWDVKAGRALHKIKLAAKPPGNTGAVSDDGRRFLVDLGDRYAAYDAASGAILWERKLNKDRESVGAVRIAPDARTVAVAVGEHLHLHELETGKVLASTKPHRSSVSALAYSGDGRLLATGSSDNTAKLLSVPDLTTLRSFEGHRDTVTALAVSGDRRHLVTGAGDRTIRVWDAETGRLVRLIGRDVASPVALAFSDDSRAVTVVRSDDSVTTWRIDRGAAETVVRAAGADSGLFLFNRSVHAHRTLVESGDKPRVLDRRDGSTVDLEAAPNSFNVHGWSANGRYLVGLENKRLGVWEAASGKRVHDFAIELADADELAVSDDARLVAATAPNEIRVFATDSGRQLRRIAGRNLVRTQFLADGKRLLAAQEEDVSVWEIASGRQVSRLRTGHFSFLTRPMALTANDQRILLSAAERMQLWDFRSGRAIRDFVGHALEVAAIAASPDGRLAATASEDATVKLWEIETGRLLATLIGTGDEWVTFTPKGTLVAQGDPSNLLSIWQHGQELPFEQFAKDRRRESLAGLLVPAR